MQCVQCNESAVFLNPTLCKAHFVSYIEEKVYSTINNYNLIKPDEKIAVAASGGKDSLSLLYILSKRYKVDCLAIDEGIDQYRERTLNDLKNFCHKHNIRLIIASFKSAFGDSLGKFLNSELKPCTICGTFRRYLINKYSRDYDKICTGHNLDDEAQSIIMNLLRPNHELSARIGPYTGMVSNEGFTQRVKPLYFIREKEIVAYAVLNGIEFGFDECPHASVSYRAKIRDLLNEYEAKYPQTKQNIIEFFLQILPKLKEQIKETSIKTCKYCHEPSKNEICNTCKLLKQQHKPQPYLVQQT